MKAGLAALFAAVLFLAWSARQSTPDLALADRDTWGYLSPALSWLSDSGFRQDAGRGWFYSALLAVALESSSMGGIAVMQKVLGLATGVLMALTWMRWVSFLPVSRPWRLGASILGVLPIYTQLLNPQTLYFELQIRPEGLMPFFVYAQLFCLLAYCDYRWKRPSPLLAALCGTAALLLAYACCLLKSSWILAAGATVAPVFAGLFPAAQMRIVSRSLPVVAGIIAIIGLAMTPRLLGFIKDTDSELILPKTVFTVHARWIKDSLQQRVDQMPDTDPDKARLEKVVSTLQREFTVAATGSHNYEFLGYDPDYIRYRSKVFGAIMEYCGQSETEFRTFCLTAYRQALLDQPAGMIGKTFTQYLHFLFPKPSTFLKQNMDIRRGCDYALESLREQMPEEYSPSVVKMMADYRAELQANRETAPTLKAWDPLNQLLKHVARAALPIEVAFLIALALVHYLPSLRDFRLGGWTAFFLLAAPAGNALTVALVHALDISRYRAGYGGFHFFALTALAVFLAVVLERIFLQSLAARKSLTPWKT